MRKPFKTITTCGGQCGGMLQIIDGILRGAAKKLLLENTIEKSVGQLRIFLMYEVNQQSDSLN